MIPKIIHYAWFGTTPPPFIEARVNEWRTQLPDWEFKFWNDKNFDLSKYAFSEKMYQAGELGYAADELRYAVFVPIRQFLFGYRYDCQEGPCAVFESKNGMGISV